MVIAAALVIAQGLLIASLCRSLCNLFPRMEFGMYADLRLVGLFPSHPREARAEAFRNYMLESMQEAGYRIRWYIINSTERNDTNRLAPPNAYRDLQNGTRVDTASAQLLANWLFGIQFALALPVPPRWIWRGTTDAFVNFRELRGWVDELDRDFDAMAQWVFLADGVAGGDRRSGFCYPQGGSGYLLSRFAAERMTRAIPQIMRTAREPDDLALGRWLSSSHAPGRLLSTPRMIGHQFWRGLGAGCPRLSALPPIPCPRHIVQARRVVVWHANLARVPFPALRAAARGVFDAPPEIHLHHDWSGHWWQGCLPHGTGAQIDALGVRWLGHVRVDGGWLGMV